MAVISHGRIESDPARLAGLVRIFRVAQGLTQAELAEAAGVTRETVGATERGDHQPHQATVRALANALGVEASELFPNAESGS